VQLPYVVGVESRCDRPTQSLAVLPGVGQPGADSLADNAPFQLGEDSQQSGHRSSGWRGQIQGLGQGNETDSEMFQFL